MKKYDLARKQANYIRSEAEEVVCSLDMLVDILDRVSKSNNSWVYLKKSEVLGFSALLDGTLNKARVVLQCGEQIKETLNKAA